MNSNRVFLALTSGLLTVGEDRLAAAWIAAEDFCRLDEAELQVGVGASVREPGGRAIALRQWIEQRRAEGVLAVRVECLQAPLDCDDDDDDDDDDDGAETDDEDSEREPHLMAGFAGGLSMLMNLSTRQAQASYIQGTVTGPSLLLTPDLFARLIERQRDADFYWEIVLAAVNQFRACNGRTEIAPARLAEHLSSLEGEDEWEFIGDKVFQEIQVEAYTFDKSFTIPPEFAHLVDPVTPVVPGLEPYIWLDIEDEDVSGAQVSKLIEAQPFSPRVWQAAADMRLLEDMLGQQYDLDRFPQISAADWPNHLRRLPDDDAWQVCEILVEVVRRECERAGTQPVIPADLADVFGPDEEGRRRLHFRGRLQHDLGWWIRKIQNRGMMYVLNRANPAAIADAVPMDESRQAFAAALRATRDFARTVESPFLPLFDLALHLVGHAHSNGDPDLAALQRSGPDLPPECWRSAEWVVEMFAPFGWGADRLLGLAAISAADVFGGMGSWNDQGFAAADQARFVLVSKELFAALNRYFDAVVSFRPGGQELR